MKVKQAVMKNGVLCCPYCKLPIESDIVDSKNCRCRWCGALVKNLSTKQHIEMIRRVDRDMLREWKIELMQ